MSNPFTAEINAIKRELGKEHLVIDKNTQPLSYAHYLVNKKLNPNKDRQSLRAALFSGNNNEPVDSGDLAEAVGYKVKPVSPHHIIDLFEAPDLTDYSDQQIIEYVGTRLDGPPGITLRKVKTWRAEGFINRRVITYIHKKLNK